MCVCVYVYLYIERERGNKKYIETNTYMRNILAGTNIKKELNKKVNK